MKKRVLIIAQHFAPENIVSALRPTKLAKYLTRAGYDVTVLTAANPPTEDAVLKQDLSECGHVLRAQRVQMSSAIARLLRRPLSTQRSVAKTQSAKESTPQPNAASSSESGLHRFLSGYRRFFRVYRREQDFYRAALAYSQHAGLDLSRFDVMISTYSPMATHMVALAFKAKCPTLKWIADYRDPMDPTRPAPLRRYYEKWQKRILCSCDAVSAASEGYLSMLLSGAKVPLSACIYNGFDPQDLEREEVEACEKREDVFTILGMGGLYAGRRDVSIVLHAVSDLIRSGKIRRNQIAIEYYGAGTSGAHLEQVAQELELEGIWHSHDRVPRKEVLGAQMRAQMLMSSGWETADYHGVIPGKFSEQLLLRKPIIGVMCGEGKESELARLITTCRVGFCYEESRHEESYEDLKKYIAESFTYYRTRKKELYEPDEKRRSAFDYNNLIRNWIELIEMC